MAENPYTELDRLAAPDGYAAIPSEEDVAYMIRFRQICRRYQIDFIEADDDERDFVMRMTEKSFLQKRA